MSCKLTSIEVYVRFYLWSYVTEEAYTGPLSYVAMQKNKLLCPICSCVRLAQIMVSGTEGENRSWIFCITQEQMDRKAWPVIPQLCQYAVLAAVSILHPGMAYNNFLFSKTRAEDWEKLRL